MAWVIGRAKGLKPGAAYLLEVEYPDDVPRTLFVANRGADLVRGFATGAAAGDCRQQYVQPSIESLNYPQTGQWQRHSGVELARHLNWKSWETWEAWPASQSSWSFQIKCLASSQAWSPL
jgi:hypothetical protein